MSHRLAIENIVGIKVAADECRMGLGVGECGLYQRIPTLERGMYDMWK